MTIVPQTIAGTIKVHLESRRPLGYSTVPEGVFVFAEYIYGRRLPMEYPMRSDLGVGNQFPDFELPDQGGNMQNLSQLLRGFPGALIFIRGYY